MRASAAEYRSLPLRAHELLRDVPLYDVSSVDLPGGGSGRTVADIRALEAETAPSHIATLLYVRRVSWLTRPYLVAIEPFRRVLYPAVLRRIRRAWLVAYTGMSRMDTA